MPISLANSILCNGDSAVLILEREPDWPCGSQNININVFRLDEFRDEFVWSSGFAIELMQKQDVAVPNWPHLPPGIYKIGSVRAVPADFSAPMELLPEHIHFAIVDECSDHSIDAAKLPGEIAQRYSVRQVAITTPINTPAAVPCTDPVEVSALAFGEGAPIHSPQHMRGWSLIPYGSGMGYEDLRCAVNAFLTPNFGTTIAFDQAVANVIAQQAPTFVVIVHKLIAADKSDATNWIEKYAKDINIILGVNKGDKPRLFATFVFHNGQCEGGFYKDHYRGNLLAPLSPGELANQFENWLPKMGKPRTR
jgi:hypothetical protein